MHCSSLARSLHKEVVLEPVAGRSSSSSSSSSMAPVVLGLCDIISNTNGEW